MPGQGDRAAGCAEPIAVARDLHGHPGFYLHAFPTYRLLDESMHGELRVLLAEEVRRWVKEDVPAGHTAKVYLALPRRSGYLPRRRVSAFKE